MHSDTSMIPYGHQSNPTLRDRIGWEDMEPWQRWALIGVGVAAGTGIAVTAVRHFTREEPISQVGPQCSDFSLSNRAEIDETMKPMVLAAAERGAVDPFTLASQFIARYAPECRSWPDQPRNPGEGQLYVAIFFEVLRVMGEAGLATTAQAKYYGDMVTVWAAAQGVEVAAG